MCFAYVINNNNPQNMQLNQAYIEHSKLYDKYEFVIRQNQNPASLLFLFALHINCLVSSFVKYMCNNALSQIFLNWLIQNNEFCFIVVTAYFICFKKKLG